MLLDPWSWVADGRGLEAELAREVGRGHLLFGRTPYRAAAAPQAEDWYLDTLRNVSAFLPVLAGR
jgi:hypothetical protein